MEALSRANQWLGSVVWGAPTLLLLTAAGVLFSARTRFVQLRRFGEMLRVTLGALARRNRERAPGAVTPFQAMCTALAATVGTGNIAGVAGAIALGGPGAVFWMWISAFLGMATKYAEVVLAVRYRRRGPGGEWLGGPMYYIRALSPRLRPLAGAFALFGALAAFGIGNMTQVNTIAHAVSTAARALDPGAAGLEWPIRMTVGILCAFAAGLVLLGGATRIGRVTEQLVPAMSLLYILAALAVIAGNLPAAARALGDIARGAFNPPAVLGGAAGIGVRAALQSGVERGMFSHEAGLGSAPIAHAAAQTDDPARQGLLGVFEVFMDTIVLCTLTALAILSSGVPIPYGSAQVGADLTVTAFSTLFGDGAAALVIAAGIALFALSTILSWSLYGEKCFAYLTKGRLTGLYRAAFIAFIVVGAVTRLDFVWTLSGTLNGLMAIPNLIALIALSGTVAALARGELSKSCKKREARTRIVWYTASTKE